MVHLPGVVMATDFLKIFLLSLKARLSNVNLFDHELPFGQQAIQAVSCPKNQSS